ncbi:hypothetical protein D9758_008402 [Tetrapyrgos nigripes]|uniref:NADH:flavin oxidoreductase/NADH oxidase N-terminal domain-containing protein n=1 Tax=Tetrapyrgos nigripes TaxID=182062 RepID=A0A8H5GDU8_9AGAR|nr:hypothetical protein D9758_008402 [Tetrapyrgos nigripes]
MFPTQLESQPKGGVDLSVLFKPMQLGPLTLRNKFFMAALTRDRNVPGNVPTDLAVEYYRQRAKGGAALIVSEGALITQSGSPWPYAPGIWSEEHVRAWKKVADAVHEEGSYIYAQIIHIGRVAHIDAPEQIASGEPVYAPSPIAVRPGGTSRFRFLPGQPGPSMPVEINNPRKFIGEFRHAAINAKKAGLDGIEVHAGGGWLIHQFLDNTVNKRSDEWGGSVENRARFGLEVLKAVTSVFGPGRVGIKLTPTGGYNDVGMPVEDTLETFTYFIKEADKLGLAYMVFQRYEVSFDETIDGQISHGHLHLYHFTNVSDSWDVGKLRGTSHDVIQTWGPLIKNAKVFGNFNYTVEEAAENIASGKLDGVLFGRSFIANPDFPKRIQHGVPLNNLDWMTVYRSAASDGGVASKEELSKGYTDYPFAVIN